MEGNLKQNALHPLPKRRGFSASLDKNHNLLFADSYDLFLVKISTGIVVDKYSSMEL